MDWATSSLPNTYMEGSTIASETRGVPYAKQVRVLPVLALNEVSTQQGWNFGCFLVLLGFRRLYSLSGKYSPSIPFPIEPEIPGTQSTRLRPQFHTESLIGKPKILKRQTHGITTKAYRSV